MKHFRTTGSQKNWFTALMFVLLIVVTAGVCLRASAQRAQGIWEDEFSTYAWWLGLNDDQKAAMEGLYRTYRAEFDAEMLQHLQAFYARMGTLNDLQSWTKYKELEPEYRELLREVAAWNERFHSDVEVLLNEQQRPRMKRVRAATVRLQHRPSVRDLPEGRVDMAELVVGLPVSEDERTALDAVLDEYEPLVINALRQNDEAYIRSVPTVSRYMELAAELQKRTFSSMQEHLESAEYKQSQQILLELARIIEPVSLQLAQLSRDWLPRFEAALSEENAKELHRRFFEKAYPQIHPDPADAWVLYDAALAIDDLNDDQRATLRSFQETFAREHELASRTMREIYFRQQEARVSTSRDKRNYQVQGIHDLIEAGLEREKLNESQFERIRSILTPEQAAKLPKWDFKDPPRPRPWDWGNTSRRRQ